MKYVSTREFRNNPGRFRKTVSREDVVLTANGEPYAVVLGVDDEEVDETLALIRQLRAQRALARIRKAAASEGLDGLPQEEIEVEVAAARKSRRSAR